MKQCSKKCSVPSEVTNDFHTDSASVLNSNFLNWNRWEHLGNEKEKEGKEGRKEGKKGRTGIRNKKKEWKEGMKRRKEKKDGDAEEKCEEVKGCGDSWVRRN